MVPMLISSTFDNIKFHLKNEDLSTYRVELEEEISGLEVFVNNIGMTQAFVSGEGPYDGLLEGTTGLVQRRKQKKQGVETENGTAWRDAVDLMEEASTQGTSSDENSTWPAAETSDGTIRILCTIYNILKRFFQLILYHTRVNLATDDNGNPRSPQSMASRELVEPLYKALAQGEIRVFCMNSDQDKPIAGNLTVVRIDERSGFFRRLTSSQPRYEALSYCWGDRKETKIINVNGDKVKIRANLHDALLALRERRPGTLIWADALCINQGDNDEKLAQIKIMGKIYQAACKVWAYLGKGSDGMDEAMPFLPMLCDRAREIETPQWSTIMKLASQGVWQATNIQGMGVRQISELPPPGSPFWLTVYELVYSEYFNRLWILQEAAFATRVEFLCGSHQISWDQMKLLFGMGVQQIAGFLAPPTFPPKSRNGSVFVMREILHNEGLGLFPRTFLTLVEMFYPLVVAFLERKLGESDPELKAILQPVLEVAFLGQSINFERMLELAVLQDCSEPKDRIFAIMGLLEAKTGEARFPWSPSQSACEVYVEAFYYLVQKDTSLQLLGMAPAEPPNELSLPSWCPTFHRQRGWQSGNTQRINAKNKDWQASSRKQIISRGSNSMKLRLNGIQVDRVHIIPGTWTAINMNDRDQTDMQREANVQANFKWLTLCLDAVFRDLETSSQLYRARLDRFWRTMLFENTVIIGDDDLIFDDFRAVIQFLGRSVSPESSFAEERAQLSIEPNEPGRIVHRAPRETRFLVALDFYITNKVFFVTDNGLFGMTYQGVQTGDALCVFQGAKMPHLLRRQDPASWTFVGEAYVPGKMHGEAEKPVDGTALETETFVLV